MAQGLDNMSESLPAQSTGLTARTVIPFACGLILFPGFIVAHECGHALAGLGFGLKTELHYALTT